MTPIATIIQNNTDIARFATWTGDTKTWLPARGTVEVPFEVWSAASKTQREGIKAAVSSGAVSLAVKIRKPGGNYEIVPFCPLDSQPVSMPQLFAEKSAGVPADPAKEAPAQALGGNSYSIGTGSNSHIVIAKGKGNEDLIRGFGIKTQEIKQPGGDVEDDLEGTVSFNNEVINAPEQKKEAAEEPAEEKAADEPASEDMTEYDATRAKVDELLAAKNYEEAHKALVEFFGEEKITFKATALSRLKTFDAIVKKYNLE